MFGSIKSSSLALAVVSVLGLLVDGTAALNKIRQGADPTIMKIGDLWYSAESADNGVWVRSASTIVGLGASGVTRKKVWSDTANRGAVWAPEITTEGGRTYIYFSSGQDDKHRMYVISADTPLGTYSAEQKLALPDDRWAIDGTYFSFEGQRYFVWSGWEGTVNVEQNLYICKMSDPLTPVGPRMIISQAREGWEKGDTPLINEGPEAIVDPNGQLHIVYSANGSWGPRYCLADLRLKKGEDPMSSVWSWYKSNGCLFGSDSSRLMAGVNATKEVQGPGHHSFSNSEATQKVPKASGKTPFAYHAVPVGTQYSWDARVWYQGAYEWVNGVTYSRQNVPGDNNNSGYSLKFYEQ